MKIAMISPLFRGGGAERCARELFEGLRAQGDQVQMFVADLRGGEPAGVFGVRRRGEKYLRALEWLGLHVDGRHLGSVAALDRLGPEQFDVVHLHNLHGGWLSIRAVHRLSRRIPCVWTLHDEWAPTAGLAYDLSRVLGPRQLRDWYGDSAGLLGGDSAVARRRKAFLSRWMPRPAAVICPSRYLEEMVRSCGFFTGVRLHRIPYGLTSAGRAETLADRDACKKAFGIAPGTPVILLMAADFASPYKGTGLAIEALHRLSRNEATLLVLGSGAERLTGVPLRVVSPGFVSEEARLACAYRAADLTLIPSVADNLPYVALESLAHETPLVAFRVGGLVEIVGEGQGGLLADPFDTGQLADAVRRLLRDADLRSRLGRSGREWTLTHCSPDGALAATRAVYQEALRCRSLENSVEPG